ncbi:MAG: BamA/TamA family outer membrane protein [Acidobacteriota bacterium]|nr:BamA/TamA family outer membrane protein [Acidobacteriota bacterium]
MKKNLVRGGLIGLVLLLTLFHTQLLEGPIRNKLVALARDAGVDLEIGRLDLNMALLKVTLEEIRVKVAGVDVRLKKVAVNASMGVLIGRISLDEVLVSDGTVNYTPPPAQPAQSQGGPMEIPSIYLGRATIEKITVQVVDQSTELDLDLKELGLSYRKQQLSAGFRTPAAQAGGRDLPPLEVTLEADTADFQAVDNVVLTVTGPQSWIAARGHMEPGFLPFLDLKAVIAADLLPEQPDLRLDASLQPWLLALELNGSRELAGEVRPFQLATAFDMAEPNWEIPLTLSMGDLVTGKLDLTKQAHCLSGELNLDGGIAALAEIVPQARLDSVDIQAWLDVDTEANTQNADLLMRLKGEQALTLAGEWRDNRLDFRGKGKLFQAADLTVTGVYDQILEARVQGGLPGLDGLEQWVALPDAACSGAVQFDLSVESDFETWSLPRGTLLIDGAAFEPFFRDHVVIELAGNADAMTGRAFMPTLNAGEPAVTFNLDMNQQQWQQLSLHLDGADLSAAGFNADITTLAEGSGDLAAPVLTGTAALSLNQEGPLAYLETNYRFADNCVNLHQVQAFSSAADINGSANLALTDPLTWDVDLVLTGGPNADFRPWPIEETPNFHMVLKGNQDNMSAELMLPDQLYPWDQIAVPIDQHDGMTMNIVPGVEQVQGASQSMRVAGVDLSEITLGIADQRLVAAADFKASDIATLRKTLKPWWPDDLKLAELTGHASFNAPLDFEEQLSTVRLDQVSGSWDDLPFDISKGTALFDGNMVTIDKPFTVLIPGARAEISQTGRFSVNPETWKPIDKLYPLAVNAAFQLEYVDELRNYMDIPEELEEADIRGTATVHADLDFEDKILTLRMDESTGIYDDHPFTIRKLEAGYNGDIWMNDLDADLDGLPMIMERKDKGFMIKAEPTSGYLASWAEDITGDAELELEVDLVNGEDGLEVGLNFRQKSGRLVNVNPWMVVTGLDLAVSKTETGYRIDQGGGILNGGAVSLYGEVRPRDDGQDIELNLFADRIDMDMLDYKVNVTVVMEYTDIDGEAALNATFVIHDGYLTPAVEIKSMITDLLATVPELYFPDPELERIKLNASIIIENPVLMEHDIAFLELQTPTLMISGNLAEPIPYSGPMNILAGSSLDLGNRTYIFKDSQVQFHPNRPNDPYLQLALESTQYGKKSTLNMSGYLSELGQKVGSDSVTDILTNYLISQVSTMVSLQLGEGETSFDNSFTFVVSTPITRWLVTRYAVPVNEEKAEQRFELTMGPFYYNLLNLVQQRDSLRGSIQYTQAFGYIERERQQIVRRIRWPEGTERRLRKDFKIRKGDLWSPSQWRRSELDLARRLRQEGYLSPTIGHGFEKGVLRVDLDLGPKTEVKLDGLILDDESKGLILRTFREDDEAGLRAVERLVESLAITRNYPYAAASADYTDNVLNIRVLLGFSFEDVALDFGDADELLAPLYAKVEDRNRLVAGYVNSPQSAQDKIRAQLAAKGYLMPEFGRADFTDIKAFSMPVDPGERGVLKSIQVNGEPSESDLVGRPFHFTMIDEIITRLTKQDKDAIIDVRPVRDGNDVRFDIEMRDIPETIIRNLDIQGAARIEEARVRRFVGFKDNMTQDELTRAQERLIAAGPYETVRMQNNEQSAVLELEEGNRWEVDFQLSLEERDADIDPDSQKDNREYGFSVRFLDHQFMNRFINLAAQLEFSDQTTRVLSQIKFLRVFGTPIDVSLGMDWQEEEETSDDFLDLLFGEATRLIRQNEDRDWNADLSYELSRYQSLSFGIRYREDLLHTSTEFYDAFAEDPFDPANLFDRESATLSTVQAPVRLSWLYRRLDHPTNPANGIFTSVAAEYYLDALNADTALLGTWVDGRFTSFKTWGRWMWSNRLEVGAYMRDFEEDQSRPEDLTSSPYFLLGGSRTVRGFDLHRVGPLDFSFVGYNEEGELSGTPAPIGGESLFFFSQEMTYDTRFYGLGINPFVDGGWVWENHDDLFSTPLVITGGLGLSLDLPIGYFRLDWAVPLYEGPFEKLLDENSFDDVMRDYFRNQVLSEFSFVFGRTF